MTPWLLALSALLLCITIWIAYMGRVPGGHVPARPWGSVVGQLLALGAALAAPAWALSGTGGGAAVWILSGVAAMMSGLFLWLLTQRETPVGALSVEVGDTLLPFRALTPEEEPFDSATLAGRRTLLKFFRGGW